MIWQDVTGHAELGPLLHEISAPVEEGRAGISRDHLVALRVSERRLDDLG
jgi:hypothetical protein